MVTWSNNWEQSDTRTPTNIKGLTYQPTHQSQHLLEPLPQPSRKHASVPTTSLTFMEAENIDKPADTSRIGCLGRRASPAPPARSNLAGKFNLAFLPSDPHKGCPADAERLLCPVQPPESRK